MQLSCSPKLWPLRLEQQPTTLQRELLTSQLARSLLLHAEKVVFEHVTSLFDGQTTRFRLVIVVTMSECPSLLLQLSHLLPSGQLLPIWAELARL